MEGRGRQISEFKTTLLYRAISRTARGKYKKLCLKGWGEEKKKKKKKEEKNKNKKSGDEGHSQSRGY